MLSGVPGLMVPSLFPTIAVIVIFLGLLTTPTALAAPPTGYTQTFGDEFDTLSIGNDCTGKARWETYWCAFGVRHLKDNGDEQIKADPAYKGTGSTTLSDLGLPTHVTTNGTLKLLGHIIPAANRAQFYNFPYVGGMITSEKSHSQMYGYWESRMRIPSLSQGMHWSMWLLAEDASWPPEIDMVERVGNGTDNNRFFMNAHGEEPPTDLTFFTPSNPNDWHTFGFLWTATDMVWYLDDIEQKRIQNYVNKPMYFLITPETGGSWSGDPDGTTVWPDTAEIDYVRVYTKSASPSTCSLLYPADSTPPTGYAASWNLFTPTKELLLDATCNGDSLNVTAGNAATLPHIYKTGYVWGGSSWQPYTFTGTTPVGDWFQRSAQATFPRQAGTTYFVGFTCLQVSGEWKCGCADSVCAVPKWQLQGVE